MRCLTVVGAIVVACVSSQPIAAATLPGTDGRDVLRGTAQADVIRGGAGNDVLIGRQQDDRLYGGPGTDALRGSPGRDALRGQTGGDRLYGDAGADRLSGGAGDDRLFGGPNNDELRGGAGNDRLLGGPGTDELVCGDGEDTATTDDDDRAADDCETVTRSGSEDENGDSWSDTVQTALLLALTLAVFLTAGVLGWRVLLRKGEVTAGRPVGEEGPVALRDWLPYTLPFPALGLVGIAMYSVHLSDASAFAVSVLLAAGIFLAGGLLGFLFGIPKSLATDASTAGPRGFKTNTNLEEISDWLTKIIVGLTLVQLSELIDQIAQFAEFLEPALGDEDSTQAYAIAILVLFSVSGFLTIYLATRLYAEWGFKRGEVPAKGAARKLTSTVESGELRSKLDDYTSHPTKDAARALTSNVRLGALRSKIANYISTPT